MSFLRRNFWYILIASWVIIAISFYFNINTESIKVQSAKEFSYPKEFPNFNLINLNNENSELNLVDGEKNIIMFAHVDCSSCLEMLPILNNIALDSNWNVSILWLGYYNERIREKLINNNNLKNNFIIKNNNELKTNGFFLSTPQVFVVDSKGTIKKGFLGFNKNGKQQIELYIESN